MSAPWPPEGHRDHCSLCRERWQKRVRAKLLELEEMSEEMGLYDMEMKLTAVETEDGER